MPRDGRDMYPRYQFDPMFQPQPVVQQIVAAFGDVSPVHIARWMESPNSCLDGKRPRELMDAAPAGILRALAARSAGGLHG